jgi:hypothetical protein
MDFSRHYISIKTDDTCSMGNGDPLEFLKKGAFVGNSADGSPYVDIGW